ncbi:MAG: iron uptake porin [Cyanobacteriota bacterium]|nr:iron uptake porin [Cyanobacteriota bacterium]
MKRLNLLASSAAAASILIAQSQRANANINIESVSDYSATLDLEQAKQLLLQVTSVNKFNDVYPTDWTYQALINLVKNYGCIAGYPNGNFRGYLPITRYEAAALLSSCLDRISVVTDDVQRLVDEFKSELDFVTGSIMLLENRVGTLEASQFSTTTKLKGQATFVAGATKAYGTQNGSDNYWDYDKYHQIVTINGRESPLGATRNSRSWQLTRRAWSKVHNKDGSLREENGKIGREIIQGTELEKHYKDIGSRKFRSRKNWNKDGTAGGARAYNNRYGAATFNYDVRLGFNTSFTGKDLLLTRLRAGNFDNNAFNGSALSLTKLDVSESTYDQVAIDRLYYRFPYRNDELIDYSLTFVVGPQGRNTEALGMWPSVYNLGASKVLDWTALAGTANVYNKATGAIAGVIYKKKTEEKGDPAFSATLNYVAENGGVSDSTVGGLFTNNSGGNLLTQIAYGGDQFGVALGYRYGQCGTDQRQGTSFTADFEHNNSCWSKVWNYVDEDLYQGSFVDERTNRSTHNFALNAYWAPEETGWIPSISAGIGQTNIQGKGFFTQSPVQTRSWFVGLKWDNVFSQGADIGLAFGQPNFATELNDNSLTPQDYNYLFELYATFPITDNITVTPSAFYLTRPMGEYTNNLFETQGKGAKFGVLGGVIQSTFKF